MDFSKIPAHIAIIMDGNGRWAKLHNLPRISGHNAGMKAMKDIVKESSKLGVKHLTVYAFSTENWNRSEEEIGGIFKLVVTYVKKELAELHKNNVKISIIGDYSKLPKDAKESLDRALEKTKKNTGLCFNIALNYGSRSEIVRAAYKCAQDVKDGQICPEDITEDYFAKRLYTGENIPQIPDPELLIRTSGEQRLSNYLLWQCAYSEFVFSNVMWPDFTPEIYRNCIEEYQKRDRRFGGRNE
ncbi:MAG: isoprenyl transferase [Eubacteriales bacterium]